jgi:hypothetical protein
MNANKRKLGYFFLIRKLVVVTFLKPPHEAVFKKIKRSESYLRYFAVIGVHLRFIDFSWYASSNPLISPGQAQTFSRVT